MVSAAAAARKKSNRYEQRKKDRSRLIDSETVKVPNCVVLTRGSVSQDVKKLSQDFQKIMAPNTLSRLQNTKKNSIKDFVAVCAQLDLTHFVAFTQTSIGIYLKMCRLPHGPTITFKIINYARSTDVLSSLKRQFSHGKQFEFSPCIMTNIQPNHGELRLQIIARMFLDMFPTITPEKASPNKIKRCCLLNYDEEKENFELRHYNIRVVPVEVCKGLKKMMGRKIPNLGRFTDVSDYMTKAGMLSDSEAEDDPSARVDVPHEKSRGIPLKSSIRLTELGPRLSLEIYKIEGGLMGGEVLYHSIIMKTDEEKLRLQELLRKKKKLKEKRRKEQNKNVEAKKKSKEEHKKKCLDGMRVKSKTQDDKDDSKKQHDDAVDADDEDDDAEYYREEVGEEPDPHFFTKKRKKTKETTRPGKKFKNEERQMGKKKMKKSERSKSAVEK